MEVPPLDDLSILWIDTSPPSERLASLVTFTTTFPTIQASLPYVEKLRRKDRVFCVLAQNSSSNTCLLRAHSQIIRFYFLIDNGSKADYCFSDIDSLFRALQKDILLFYQSLTGPWNVFSRNVKEASLRQLSTDSAAFVWHQLLLDIIQKLPDEDDEEAKREFLAECRSEYSGNSAMKTWIDRFDQKYRTSDAIAWYTRDTFVYRLLNRALRMQEVDIVYKCRFMLKELCQQLARLQKSSDDLAIETVFRVQKVPLEELEKLRNSIGRLIAMSSFLSTSIGEEVSKAFGDTNENQCEGEQWLLYKITIAPDMERSHIFAYIGQNGFSVNPDEMEVLFAPGAVFRVDSIPELDAKVSVWCINLSLATHKQCIEIERTMNSIRQRHAHFPNTLLTLGAILAEIGYFNSSLRFYQTLLQKTLPQPSNLSYSLAACVYSDIGALYYERGQYDQAIHFTDRALEIDWRCRPRNTMSLLKDCMNRGLILSDSNRNAEAMYAFFCALILVQIMENSRSMHDSETRHSHEYTEVCGQLYNNIGMFAQKIGKFSAALRYYMKCDELLKGLDNMINRSKILLNIATLYNEKEDYSHALVFFNDAIEIQERVYPDQTHAILSKSYASVALCYANIGRSEEALCYISKSLAIEKSQTPLNYVTLADCYNSFGVIRTLRREFQEALQCVEQAYEYGRKAGLNDDHPDIQLYRASINTAHINLLCSDQ
ncbi:unnamed protein product [Rotaria magnacalcarata]|uniref:Uncharacterized protein n=1 Tax=Rotaria magnacalcarata TaxID=392030 RepID=A0A819X378_9BILA|nr:unnamed protein product [Rotaria magnacalcarata]CAF4134445.1 unnamed protein product [Rotaria magnacalcarata]